MSTATIDRPAATRPATVSPIRERIPGPTIEDLVAPLFTRHEPRRQALLYAAGLLAGGHHNSWTLADAVGDDAPWRMQRLLTRARWDAEALRAACRARLVDRLGDERAVLVLDETFVAKKGTESVAVDRQYAEDSRRVENGQSTVVASYVSPHGAVVLDQELYLPPAWVGDPERCRRAAIPEDRLRTGGKPALARRILARLAAEDVPVGWVYGGPTFGRDRAVTTWLEAQGRPYVLEVPATHPVVHGGAIRRAGDVAADPATPAARRFGRGRRAGEWAWVPVGAADGGPSRRTPGFVRALAVERDPDGPARYYLVHAPEGTRLQEVATTAWARRTARGCVRTSRERAGMHSYEVRTWTAWQRHTALAMLALTMLTAPDPEPGDGAAPDGPGPYAVPRDRRCG